MSPFLCDCGNGLFTVDIEFPDIALRCRDCGEELHGTQAIFRRWRIQRQTEMVAASPPEKNDCPLCAIHGGCQRYADCPFLAVERMADSG